MRMRLVARWISLDRDRGSDPIPAGLQAPRSGRARRSAAALPRRGATPPRPCARPTLGPADAGEELGQRAGVEAGTHQVNDPLAVTADHLRIERRRLVGPVQPPVLFQFPRQEAEDAGDADQRDATPANSVFGPSRGPRIG